MMVGDTQTGTRRVVRIYNDDESELLASFMAVNTERPERAERTTFTFIDMEEGYPQVIRSWFYPGRKSGLEFIYPKEQALEIVQHARETVLASEADLAALDEERGIEITADLSDLEGIEIEAIEPGEARTTSAAATQDDSQSPETIVGIETQQEASAVNSRSPEPSLSDDSVSIQEDLGTANESSSNAQIAQNEQPSNLKDDTAVLREKPSEQAQEAQSESDDTLDAQNEGLPATAGALPLLGLFGALSVGLGLGVRIFSIR
jgi:hypothetical protein